MPWSTRWAVPKTLHCVWFTSQWHLMLDFVDYCNTYWNDIDLNIHNVLLQLLAKWFTLSTVNNLFCFHVYFHKSQPHVFVHPLWHSSGCHCWRMSPQDGCTVECSDSDCLLRSKTYSDFWCSKSSFSHHGPLSALTYVGCQDRKQGSFCRTLFWCSHVWSVCHSWAGTSSICF